MSMLSKTLAALLLCGAASLAQAADSCDKQAEERSRSKTK